MKDKKIYLGAGLAFLLLMTISLSYAYFSASVSGNDNAKDVVVNAGTLSLVYADGPEIKVENIRPGKTITKEVTVKNTGTLDTNYNIIWQSLINEITNNELVLSATCQRLNANGTEDGTCKPITELPVKAKTISKNISIEAGFTHKYTFTFLFKETNSSQDYNQGKKFSGVLGIEEYKDIAIYCTYDGELTQGAEYVNGQYTYRYMQEGKSAYSGLAWNNISNNGWGVQLTDKASTDSVTSKVCTYINNKPVVSMSYMFSNSKATTLDLSNFDTSKVTNMGAMFSNSKATTLDVSNFDTSKVTGMDSMFYRIKATTLDVSNFNTSKVTNMSSMFEWSQATTLDVSNFNTSKVTDMSYMFAYSQATTLDVSNFDTSNVTNMNGMFYISKATTLDVSNFDTSNVTNMYNMFSGSEATTLDVSNFDTSNVTNMNGMFGSSQATTLDVSNFNTSNVTNMSGMFYNSQATTLEVSNFNTSNVTNMSEMFSGSKATTLEVSNFDTSNVTNMSKMFSYSKATTLDVSNFNTSNVTTMSDMFYDSKATTLDVSNFDTSNVTTMAQMFESSQATTLDVSNFDTSKVTSMGSMFQLSQATTLDLSNFNTTNVTNMSWMFYYSKATTLDVSNFDTSKVTNMGSMFVNSKATTLDLSNFNTSNVTNMSYMFNTSTNLKTIYVGDKFNTNNVTSSANMFTDSTKLVGGAGTKYNSSYIDKTYARIDGGTSNPGYFTDIADKDIPAPNSFATDSWKTIIKAVKNNNISKYHVGDTRTIDMGTYGTHTLRIANTSTPSECSRTGFSQTACGFVLEFADIITNHKMNDTDTNVGGWPATSMRTFVNNNIYNAIPSEIKNAIIDTTVVSGHGPNDTANFTSTDKLYLLSPKEIYTDYSATNDTAINLTRALDYYTSIGVTTSSYSGAIKKNGTSAAWWWLRAAYSNITNFFLDVSTSGSWIGSGASASDGVAPAFRLG